jgi:AcrR family transcriptional regulator
MAKDTRQRILDAAIELFNADGVAGVTTNHVAAHLGISPGNLYYHFANKEEIIREIFDRMNAEAEEAWRSVGPGAPVDPLAIQRLVTENLRLFGRYVFVARELPALLHADARLREAYRAVAAERMKQLEDGLAALASAGLLRDLTDAEDRRALAEMAWMLALFCVPHAETLADSTPKSEKQRARRTRDAIEKGALLVIRLFEPYMDPIAYAGLVVLVRSELEKHA